MRCRSYPVVAEKSTVASQWGGGGDKMPKSGQSTGLIITSSGARERGYRIF